MGGFKRNGGSKPKSTTSTKPKQSRGISRKREASAGTARRGRKRKSEENEEEEGDVYPSRKHVFYEEEDEDIQAGYREDGGIKVGDIWIPPKFTRQDHQIQGERLIIEKIMCENFKSYGGVKDMGPFHKNFTSIVGPNGNGKSNIIDAMLFVFGYRNTKLRCKKASLLIHNSELLTTVHTCAVTVHFVKVLDEGGDDENITVIPDSRITVTRRVDFQNKSVYLLDGREVKFHDVAAFIKTNGVDIVNNRFLILQGEVESIAQMPPKQKTRYETGVLEYLEDIIGTRRYGKPLCQLEEKVEELNFEREAKLHSVDIVEKEKRELKEPVEKAKDFLRAKNSLNRNKHKFYQYKIYSTRSELAEVEAEKKRCEDRLAETMKRIEEIEATNSVYEKECKEKTTVAKGFEDEKLRLKKKLETAESQFTKLKEQITRANNQRKKVIKDIGTGEKDLEELEQIPLTAEKNLKDLQKRREDLDNIIDKEEKVVEKEINKLNAKVEKLSKQNEGLVKTFMDLKKVRDEKKQKSEVLESELNVCKEQEKNERLKLETMGSELETLKTNMKVKNREARSSMGSKIGSIEQDIRQKTQELTNLSQDEKLAKTEAENTRVAYENARETFENCHTNDNIYKAFFAEQSKGRFKGLYGRLRDLATIDEKYNVAATVASGLWDHWVVDTDTTAEEAIKFLRQHNLPFQNFQCLNKLQRYLQLARKVFKAPQNSQRLYDLIKISKPEVAAAFYKALNDTLVTQNIDIGSQIAYAPTNRNRVTTLAGEVIDPSGQMTGGGRQKIIGKMNGRMAARLERSLSEQDYKQLKVDMDQALKHYNEISTRRQTVDEDVRNLTLKLRDIQVKIDSSKTDLESMQNQLKLKERRVVEQEQKVKEATVSPKLLQEKERQVKKAQEVFEVANEPCAKAEVEVKKIEDKLTALQCEQRKEIRKKLDFSIEQRRKVIEDFNKHSVALKNYSKNSEKLKLKLESLRKDKTNLENEMLKMEESKKELTEKAVSLSEASNENTVSLDKAKKDLHELKSSMSEFNKKRGSLDKERVVQENELSNSTGKYKVIADTVNSVKGKMTNIELDRIPEEEVGSFVELEDEELEELDAEELAESIAAATRKLKNEKPNLGVLEQYQHKVTEFIKKVDELDEVTTQRDKFRNAYITTIGQRLSEFMEGFAIISSKLKEMFRMISMGGDAELELVDSTDPFSCGVSMCVRPANKAWKKITNLSGGEKTLASLALIFALHHYKPSPFYIMDEIDAALDFKNVSIIANYIKDRTKFTQFIIISLRSHMFELADSMLGVYKVDNMSYSIHIHIGVLLSKLRTKFKEAGRSFPLETDYQANNRAERRKEMEKVIEAKRKSDEKDTLFNAEFSLIKDDDEDDNLELSQSPKSSQAQKTQEASGQTDPKNRVEENMDTRKLDDAETQKINEAETQKISESQGERDVQTPIENEERVDIEESIQSEGESAQLLQEEDDDSVAEDYKSCVEENESMEENEHNNTSYEERVVETPPLKSSSEAEG